MLIVNRTIKNRLLSKIWINPETGCWLWTGCLRKGYGAIWCNGRMEAAHRVSYQEFKGPIPKGLELDHTCHHPETCAGGETCAHRRCINPEHLDPVTTQVNLLRGCGLAAQFAKATHCKNGHPFEGHNLVIAKTGQRMCRTCKNKRVRLWRVANPGRHPRRSR